MEQQGRNRKPSVCGADICRNTFQEGWALKPNGNKIMCDMCNKTQYSLNWIKDSNGNSINICDECKKKFEMK